MSNIKLNCCKCGKELGLGTKVTSDGVLWKCEDCAIKQMQENDKKDQRIADLEAKLAVSENTITNLVEDNRASQEWYKKQLEEKEKENELMAKTLKMTKFVEKEVRQDKIEFAVEKLTEVRDYVKECNSLDMLEGKVRLDLVKHIRLKIEKLKKENE